MTRNIRRFSLSSCLVIGLLFGGPAVAAGDEDLEPYKIIRSLQFVQDSVVQGDHSAGEMQRFILETIDKRLRTADQHVFDDPRNVDAALIYAMSGGNPATLEYLVQRDVAGNFDGRVVDALRKYFNGQGTLIAKGISGMVPEYEDTRIGPYLALVSGNIVLNSDVDAALHFFDVARLTAPGTIIEEAAIRRSLTIAVESNRVDQSMHLANVYVRRFLHSPYASQFVSLFVQLVVSHDDAIHKEDVDATLALMDADRAREIYLRIARRATLLGKTELARSAAADAEKLASATPDGREALGSLYGNVAAISSSDITSAVKAISEIPDDQLSDRDRALRDAARAVAQQILQAPGTVSQTQAGVDNPVAEVGQVPSGAAASQAGQAGVAAAPEDGAYRSFVEQGRSQLDAIDALLKKEGVAK